MSLIDLGKNLYRECCDRHGVKPNAVIVAQLDRPDVLRLECLDASQTFLGSKGVLAVLDVVRQHRCLRTLRLPKNGVDQCGIDTLCRVLEDGHPCLTSVDVSHNDLSTPSARVLCDTARRCGRPLHIETEGCGLVEEWETRLRRTLATNVEVETLGYHKCGPPRLPHRWHTAFVLVLGDDALVRQYCARVLPVVTSYMAKHRVRVAPVTVRATDSLGQVEAKVMRCREPANGSQCWCVVLMDGNARGATAAALKGPQLTALESLLRTPEPTVPPLRNKLGVARAPVYRLARSLFVYTEVSIEERVKRGTDAIGLAEWLPAVGFPAQTAQALVALKNDTPSRVSSAVVTSGVAASVRYQADLVSSFCTLFRVSDDIDDDNSGKLATAATNDLGKRPDLEDNRVLSALVQASNEVNEANESLSGALHEKKAAVVMHYLLDSVKSTNVPLLLYGAAYIGKGELLSYAAAVLRTYHHVDSVVSAPSPSDPAAHVPAPLVEPYHRVVCLRVPREDNSIIVLMYRLLALFSHAATQPPSTQGPRADDDAGGLLEDCTSVAMLTETLRHAIEQYRGPRMAVLLSCLDQADACGFTSDVLVEWLPHSFPGSLSVVVSITTESPALPALRTRSPQPYECLVPPLSELNRVHLWKRFLREKQVHLPGVELDRLYTRRDELKAAENAFLAKEDCVSFVYIRLAAVYLHFLVSTGLVLGNEYDSLDAVEHRLPPTVRHLVEQLCHKLETFNDPVTLRYALLCLCVAPLAITDLQCLCEELGPCEKNTTLPALLQLSDTELVTWSNEGTVSVAHHAIRDVFLSLYADGLDRVSVLVESHLHRQLTTRSAEVGDTFRYLVPIMLHNGSFQQANQLMLDPAVIDFALFTNAINRYYAMDGYFRLLQARDVLTELAAMDTDGLYTERDIDDDALRRSLRDLQQCRRGNLLQCSLLQRSATPFSSAARKLVSTSLESLPYPVLLPTNDGDEDINTMTWDCCGTPGSSIVQCSGRGEYLVVTTEDTVMAFHVGTGREVARLHAPFEKDQPITGALMATGTRVVVVGAEQILVWDFEGRSFFLFGELTTTAHVSFMDAFGTTLIARHVETGVLCVVDITRKLVVRDIPHIANEPVRNAVFCGSSVLVMSTTCLFLFDSAMEDYTTLTHKDAGILRSVACNADGRLIASTMGSTLYVWTARGSLLHCMDIGGSPVTGLHFDTAGTLLLTRQAEGSRLWKTLTGGCVMTLTNPLDEEEVNYTTFTQDSTRLLGRSGNRLIVWEAQHCTPLGVYTAPRGVYTYIHEVQDELFCATSTGIVKRYNLRELIPSVESSRAGALSTDWRQNAKVSVYAVDTVCAGESDYIVALDARKAVHVYHRVTGARVSHVIERSRCIATYGAQTILSVPEQTMCLCMTDLATQDVRRCALPRDVVQEAEMMLFSATCADNACVGLSYYVPGHSALLVFSVRECALVCNVTAHAGRSLHAFIVGSFVYSAGADGGLGVWHLSRKAQRASYQHSHALTVATSNAESGLLYVMDTEGRLFQAHVDRLTSPSRAQFTVAAISVPHITRHVRLHPAAALRLRGAHIICVTRAGSVLIATTDGVPRLNEVHLRSATTCTELLSATDDSCEFVVLTGHCDGRVLSSRLLVPCYTRPEMK